MPKQDIAAAAPPPAPRPGAATGAAPTTELTDLARIRRRRAAMQAAANKTTMMGGAPRQIAAMVRDNLVPIRETAGAPDYLRTAERDLMAAADRLKTDGADADPAKAQAAEKAFERAFAAYNIEAAHFIYQATKNGREDADPASRSALNPGVRGANVRAALIANLGFSIPAGVAVATNLGMRANGVDAERAGVVSDMVFAGAVGALQPYFSNRSEVSKSANGGVSPTYMFGGEGEAKTGAYKKVAGGLGDSVASTFVYALARAGFLEAIDKAAGAAPAQASGGEIAGRAAAATIVAALSALTTSVVKESVLTEASRRTLAAADAPVAAKLPIDSHNRTHPVGVRLNHVKSPNTSTDGALGNVKSRTRTVDAASSVIGAAALGAIGYATRGWGDDFGGRFGKVMIGFSGFFAVKALMTSLATKTFNHPQTHASIHAKSSNETLVKDLRASTLSLYNAALSQLGAELSGCPERGESAELRAQRDLFSAAKSAFGPYIEVMPMSYQPLARRLEEIGDKLDRARTGAPQDGATDRSLSLIAAKLTQAADGLNAFYRLRFSGDGARSYGLEPTGFGRPRDPAAEETKTPGGLDACCGGWFDAEGRGPAAPSALVLADARKALYDAQALMISHETQLSGSAAQFTLLTELTPVFAALEAVEREGRAGAVIKDLKTLDDGLIVDGRRSKKMKAEDLAAAKSIMARLDDTNVGDISPREIVALYAKGRTDDAWIDELSAAFRAFAATSSRSSAIGQVVARPMIDAYPRAKAKMQIVQSLLADARPKMRVEADARLAADRSAAEDIASMRAQLRAPNIEGREITRLNAAAKRVQAAFDAGALTVETFAATLRAHGGDIGDAAFARMRTLIGEARVDVAMAAFPGAMASNLPDQISRSIGRAVAAMDGDVLRLWDDAAKLNPVLKKAPLETIRQNNAHEHPTGYDGAIDALFSKLREMDENDIGKTNAAGIPSQLVHSNPELTYYAAAQKKPGDKVVGLLKGLLGLVPEEEIGLRYRSHDEELARDVAAIAASGRKADADRILLSMTGVDLTDERSMIDTMNNRMLNQPGLFRSVGEVTLLKEIVSGLNPEAPKVYSSTSLALLEECRKRGLPLLLHCDRGSPNDKHMNADDLEALLEKWANGLRERAGGLRNVGAADDVASRKGAEGRDVPLGKVCWAHGAGLARFTPDASDHAERLDRLLSKEVLKPHLFVDLSWDYTAQNIIQNVRDTMITESRGRPEPVRAGVSRIAEHMDGLIKSYRAFAAAGGQADKAKDLGDYTQSALHVLTGKRIAQAHLNQLSTFKAVVRDEIRREPRVAAVLTDLMTAEGHSKTQNNWLKLFADHSDRMMFGTDSLTTGSKAHGEAAFALNSKILHPIYYLMTSLADAADETAKAETAGEPVVGAVTLPDALAADPNVDPETAGRPGAKLRGIVKNIAEDAFTAFFEDPDMARVRAAYEARLREEQPTASAGQPEARTIAAPGAADAESAGLGETEPLLRAAASGDDGSGGEDSGGAVFGRVGT